MNEDRILVISRLLQKRMQEALAEPGGRAMTPDAAKGYATALKILREVEEGKTDGSQEVFIKFEGGDEAWTK